MVNVSVPLVLIVAALVLIIIDAFTGRCPPWIWGLFICLVLLINSGGIRKLW